MESTTAPVPPPRLHRSLSAGFLGLVACGLLIAGSVARVGAQGSSGTLSAPFERQVLAPSGPPEGSSAASTIKATEGRVLNAIENGVDSSTTLGRMPGGILNEQQSQEVAEFVAHTAGEG